MAGTIGWWGEAFPDSPDLLRHRAWNAFHSRGSGLLGGTVSAAHYRAAESRAVWNAVQLRLSTPYANRIHRRPNRRCGKTAHIPGTRADIPRKQKTAR